MIGWGSFYVELIGPVSLGGAGRSNPTKPAAAFFPVSGLPLL